MMFMTFTEKLGGRKFVFSIFVTMLCFILVLMGKIISADFMKLVFGILTVYAGTNAITKFSKSKEDEPKYTPADK